MPAVIAVKFAYAARDLWFSPGSSGAVEGDHVICSTERGVEIGLATSDAREVSNSELNNMIGNATLKPVIRIATEEDLARAEMLAKKGEDAFPRYRELVSQSELDIKPVGVEYLFGGEKVVCYFAAEERVDFRQLVRDLSRELRERIDMRQIGVREEAAVVGGFGHCGQELCCSRFGLSFEPVSIRMAKEQDLPLTSNKISGACGRLMCCLRYEFEAYRDFKGRAPKRNAVIETPLGKAKIVEYDTPKEQVALRLESGKVVRIPLAEMATSDAAKKKSEELHCPCRPDTVLRSSLEKLSSPDVQMALAELDRKMGVVPIDTFDEADIFIETKRRRKRKAAVEETVEQAPPEQATRRSRRRRNGKPVADAAQPTSDVTPSIAPAPENGEKKTRRRRRKRGGSGVGNGSEATAATTKSQPQAPSATTKSQPQAPSAPDSTEQRPKETRRRRHHRSTAGAGAAPTAEATQPQRQKAQQSQAKRRPGDRGGQKAQEQRQEQRQEQQGAQGAPKRRRRHRGGRGRSGQSTEA